ncbi:hypothetical protein NEDG_00561 [Nematocida displodere]|uniref:Uncharacterized protein n=1 Tax=Nematocida displodere TaxID=1805483 RepID=A0A177EC78_9MICR|nr:hypothetical protein NEDG_00561 [Nematocida displodere]
MMDEERRYAWIEMFRRGDNPTSYDHIGVKECFNEFFEGVMQIDRGKDIQRYYRISLHLIMFLTIQQVIKEELEGKKEISPEDQAILELRPQAIFWPATQNMPKPFIFTKVPPLSIPEENLRNIKEIAKEIAGIMGAPDVSPPRKAQYKILLRIIRGEDALTKHVFLEDDFSIDTIQPVFKLFMRYKHNRIIDKFFRQYEIAYFLSFYCQNRFSKTAEPFADEDVLFFKPRKGENDLLPDARATKNPQTYDLKVSDRKFIIVVDSCMQEFSKRLGLSKAMDTHLHAITRTFLSLEKSLGYFEDYTTEALVVAFSYIAITGCKKTISLAAVYDVYQEMGFLSSWYLYEDRLPPVTIEDLVQVSIIKTYNSILPAVMRNHRPHRKTSTPSTPTAATPTQPPAEHKGTKYILSPLSGRMSQILPVDTSASRRVLFTEDPSTNHHSTDHSAPHQTPDST